MALSKLVALSGLCQGITLDHDEFSINLLPSQVNIQTVQVIDETPADLLDMIEQKTKDKPYLKYYYSSEKFVPTQELNVVYLNGMKFFQQGGENQPEIKNWWTADTRSANKVQCEGRLDQKLYQMEHRADKASTSTMANDFITFDQTGTDPAAAPDRLGGGGGGRGSRPTPKRKAARQAVPQDSFDFARTGGDLLSASGIDLAALFGDSAGVTADGGVVNADVSSTTSQTTTTTTTDTSAVVIETRFPKIGCCNGVPYNSSKRCCCRRVAFDKDAKFCCAINGCQKFKVFDKADPKNYDLCRGLSGLVVQEYGYRGLFDGEPNLAKAQKPRRPSV